MRGFSFHGDDTTIRLLTNTGPHSSSMARAKGESRPMTADLFAYSFRPAVAGDLPRLRRWLHAPEVMRWWGDPREQFELLRADLNEPRMAMRIVSFNGRPFAYAQDYAVHAWPQPHLTHLPQGARAIDSFIGCPSMVGRGHGSAYLSLLAQRLCAEGAPLVAIDPAADNLRALRAYVRAGFRFEARVETETGQSALMIYNPMRQASSPSPRLP